LQEDYPRFEEVDSEILAVSVEDATIGQHVSELLEIQYPILSDIEHKVADQYGVYNLLGDSLATPSVFLIDMEGIIRWAYVGQSSADRPSDDTILEQLRGLNPL
jgi:peroxiredoxin